MIFYISDIHFKDQKIFDKCKRPFKSLKEMENNIILNWNSKVKDDDTVYILGDIGKDDDPSSIEVFKKLNGHKHLIVGNHDHELLDDIEKSNIFESIKFIDVILDENNKVCICHYPLMDWMEFNREGLLVYGHIHNKTEKNGYVYKLIKDYYSNLPAYNAGVDVIGFEPRTLKELIKLKEESNMENNLLNKIKKISNIIKKEDGYIYKSVMTNFFGCPVNSNTNIIHYCSDWLDEGWQVVALNYENDLMCAILKCKGEL